MSNGEKVVKYRCKCGSGSFIEKHENESIRRSCVDQYGDEQWEEYEWLKDDPIGVECAECQEKVMEIEDDEEEEVEEE
jgi:hypothetical protein